MQTTQPVHPRRGDVLVSNRRATLTCDISFFPDPPHRACPTLAVAIAEGRRLAEQRSVKGWLTEDQTHYLALDAEPAVAGGLPGSSASPAREIREPRG